MILKYCLCLWKSVKISLDDNTNEPVQLFFERCKFHVSGSIKMFTFYTGIGSWTSKMFWFLNSIYIRNLPSLVLSLMERCIIWLYSLYMYSIQHLKQNIENIRENHNFWFNIWYFMQHLVRTNRTMKLHCKKRYLNRMRRTHKMQLHHTRRVITMWISLTRRGCLTRWISLARYGYLTWSGASKDGHASLGGTIQDHNALPAEPYAIISMCILIITQLESINCTLSQQPRSYYKDPTVFYHPA